MLVENDRLVLYYYNHRNENAYTTDCNWKGKMRIRL